MKIENSRLSVYPIEGFSDGLTKRELFAAMAMQGLLANNSRDSDFKGFANDSIKFADELLKELEK